jgi:hypothetical protein
MWTTFFRDTPITGSSACLGPLDKPALACTPSLQNAHTSFFQLRVTVYGSRTNSSLVQADKAKRLRDDWAAKDSPPCDHPQLAKEYVLGAQTGDKVCTTCGEDFSRAEWKAMER